MTFEASLVEQKRTLRKETLAKRDSLSLEQRNQKDAALCDQLLEKLASFFADTPGSRSDNLLSLAGKRIAVYQAMRSEVDLAAFDHAAYDAGAQICFPCMMKLHAGHSLRDIAYEGQRSFMVFREVPRDRFESGDIPFAVNPLKFYEPDDPLLIDFPLVDPEDLDAVIVPMVAFDEHFNRLGYGGGNYDHVLPRLRSDARVIGVAFAEQEAEAIPLEPHDQALPLIISA